MLKHMIDRHELKEDQVLGWIERLVLAVKINKEKVLVLLVVLLAVFLSFMSLNYVSQKRKEQAYKELFLAKKDLEQGQEERGLAALKTISTTYAKLNEGMEAMYLLLDHYYKKAQYKDAVELTKFALSKFKNEEELTSHFLLVQAQCFEQMKEYDYAIKSLKRLVELHPAGYMVPEAYLAIARNHMLSARPDQAKEVYRDVMTKYADTVWAQKAKDLLPLAS